MAPQGTQRPYEITLPVFKDEDTKDAITYQSWCWDLTVYHCTGCQDCTLLPYTIHCLQGYPGGGGEEFGDRHHPGWCPHHAGWTLQQCQGLVCFEPGTLSATNGWKRDSVRWGVYLSKHLQVLVASFPEHFPLDHIAVLKHDHFYGGLPKQLKAMVTYLEASTNKKTYSSYLWAVREAEKEEVMEPSHSQMAVNPTKPKVMSFLP